MKLASRMDKIEPSATIEIAESARKLEQKGEKVIKLQTGEPHFHTCDEIKSATSSAMYKGETFYSSSRGVFKLRKKICDEYNQKYNTLLNPKNNILITPGAKQGILYVLLACVEKGDEVIIPSPCWQSYSEIVKISGGSPIYSECEPESFDINIESIKLSINERTRAIIINSPNNPTGKIVRKEILQKLLDLCHERNLILISDEIYGKLIFEGYKHISIAEINPTLKNCVIVNGFSKSYAMSGWRLGYVIGDEELMATLVKLQQHSVTCPTTFIQHGVVEAIETCENNIKGMMSVYQKNKDFFLDEIRNLENFDAFEPEGGFYVIINISKVSDDSRTFCLDLLLKHKIATTPGIAFGECLNKFIRVSIAKEREDLLSFVNVLKNYYSGKDGRLSNQKNKQRIMFLGAGISQVKAIEKANELGYETIALDYDSGAPGLKTACVGLPVNFVNYKKAIEVGKRYKIKGVIAVCNEAGVVPAAQIASSLNLPGISLESAEACTNKIVMRKKLRDAGIKVPNFIGTDILDDAIEFAESNSFPLIIKPAVGSGSRGVRKINDLEDLKKHFSISKKISQDGKIILEKFVVGEEVSVESMTHKGRTEILGISDKVRTGDPYRTDLKVIYPTSFSQEIQDKIVSLVKRVIKVVGVDNCPTHTEILVNQGDLQIVEIAARGGGFDLFNSVVPAISGVDVLKESINFALGNEASIKPKFKKAAILHFFKEKPGTLVRIMGEKEAKSIPGVIDLLVSVKPGEKVSEYTCGDDRIGHFIAEGDNLIDVERIEKKIRSTLKFEVK